MGKRLKDRRVRYPRRIIVKRLIDRVERWASDFSEATGMCYMVPRWVCQYPHVKVNKATFRRHRKLFLLEFEGKY